MKKLIIAIVFASLLLVSSASAVVIRNVTAELKDQQDRYEKYKSDYIKNNNLEGYEKYIYEPNLARNFGFYPRSRYIIPADVYQAKFNPPLQGDDYSTANRPRGTSLAQPSAVKYYAENTNGRLSGHILPDKNGVYFDHPDARVNYGYIGPRSGYSNTYQTSSYGYGYDYRYEYSNYDSDIRSDFENSRYYARIAQPLSDNYYVVGFR